MADTDLPQFSYPHITKRVNGVFKGGGAKGIVYVAALHEFRPRGMWFKSVAGSSAGAITAMLIAVGHDPRAIVGEMAGALASVKTNWFRWARPHGERSLFRTDELESWLEDQLKTSLSLDADSEAVTFVQLAKKRPEIELNVVGMDLATKQPIVFNATTTPKCSVAAAVVASSALPVAMRPRRFVVKGRSGTAIHRVVDGGAWANYPAFVYKDKSFRSFNGLAQLPVNDTVVGFVIEGQPAMLGTSNQWPPDVPNPIEGKPIDIVQSGSVPSRFDLGSARRMGFWGAILSWSALRIIAGVGGAALLVAIVLRWWFSNLDGWTIEFGSSLPRIARTPVQVATYLVVALFVAVLIAFVIAQIRIVHEAIDVGVPALVAAMSVGPGVPAWVGHDPDDIVVRLSAPAGIETQTFRPGAPVQYLAMVVAGHQTDAELRRRFPDSSRDATAPRAEQLLDVEHRFNDAQRYRLIVERMKEQAPQRDGGVTSVVVFYGLLFCALLYLDGGAGVVAMVIFGTLFAAFTFKRLVTGRRINQSLHSPAEPPKPQRFVGRLVSSGALVALAVVLSITLSNSEKRPSLNDEFTIAVMGTVIGVLMIGGVGGLVSVVSRLIANAARRRYLVELAAKG